MSLFPPAAHADGSYKDEINYSNPLGMKGLVAIEFGQLLDRLWSRGQAGAPAAIAPSSLLVRASSVALLSRAVDVHGLTSPRGTLLSLSLSLSLPLPLCVLVGALGLRGPSASARLRSFVHSLKATFNTTPTSCCRSCWMACTKT